jgi:hypothetical protein
MGFFKIIKRLIGGLNLDNTPDDLPKIDYVSGYDVVDRNPSKSSEDKYLQPENNNELAYLLGNNDTVQSKIYRVKIDVTGVDLYEQTISIKFYYKYGASWDWNIYYSDPETSNGKLWAILSAELNSVYTFASNEEFIGDNILLFDLDMVSFYGYSDYFISFSDSADPSAIYTTYVLQDAISVEKTGTLVPIEFTNVNSAQQVWATPKSKEPEETQAVGTQINSGTDLELEFGSENVLESGEEVYIYGNGIGAYVTVQNGSNTYKYVVVASYNFILGTGSCLFPAGTYTVVKYKRTLSTIGYAVKNYLNDTWTYTELIRSINLNFRTYKQIQAYGMITNNGTIYNWTDYLNQIKRLYYFGTIMNQGFLTVYNSEAIYDLDTIGQESRLQLGTNTAKVSLSVATSTGLGGKTGYTNGSKPEACYAAFVRFKTIDGAYTTFSKASNVVWLHSLNLLEHKYGNNSGRALQIGVEQIEYRLFQYMQIGIIEFTTASWKGYLLPEILVNDNDSIYVADTGFDSESYIDFNDAGTLLEQIPFVFENAKSILPYALYEIAANVNIIKDRDLTEWAKEISISVVATSYQNSTIDYCDDAAVTWLWNGINGYDKCSTLYTSYMPYDTYRFCVFIDWEDGSPTSTYWIDDVNINLNPYVTDASTPTYIYQYYIEATNINIDYVLPNGEFLRDVIKDIRFGRALCNPQVLTTGAYILSSSAYAPYTLTDSYYTGATDASIEKRRLTLYSPDLQNSSNVITYQTGDMVYAFENDMQNSYNLSLNDYAMDFFANAATGVVANAGISAMQTLQTGQSSNITNLLKFIPPSDTIQNRRGVVMELSADIPYTLDYGFGSLYYVRPYPTVGAYPEDPTRTRFFVIPQDQWFDKLTHTSSTVYSLYGGDAFAAKSYYKIAENQTALGDYNNMVGFYSFNRTNPVLRSGAFPNASVNTYLKFQFLLNSASPFNNDVYTYDECFTPRYSFQNQVAFNPYVKQITKLGTSIFYSEQSVSYDLAGGNRVWLPLNRKDLETTYGDIIHMEILLGFSETGLLIVWQPQRTTAQYFDNTANIKSSSGELLIGNGEIMARKGADFTEYGCEHKWTIRKGQNSTGKDIVFWACFRKGAIMRLGSDGTADLVGDINTLLTNKTFLALQNEYNLDIPAHNYGCHAVWNNQTKEYILTLTLIPKTISKRTYSDGDWAVGTETWGFENFPVVYKSIGTNNQQPPFGNWEEYSGYDSDVFQIWTLVWNELDNKFKTFRTFNPKIYGQFNNTYVSSHPNYPDKIYEHNKNLNEALFYCTMMTYESGEIVTNPELYRIEGAGIESILPSIPFTPNERTKWVVKIEGKNYEIVGGGTDYLQMASVDNDDILPEYTFPRIFIYYICNSQDPYIEGVVNESMPRYVNFVLKNTQADDTLKRVEYYAGYDSLGTVTTQSFTNKEEEEFYNGESNVQIKMDTTNNPTDNEVGENLVEGKWMRFKQFWRWGKKNRVLTTSVAIEETEYKKQ